MVDLVHLCMNSLNGQPIRKDKGEEFIIQAENWLAKNNDERFVDYEAPSFGEYVFNYTSDPGIDKKKLK